MIEWITAIVTSVIGAGAGTAFDKFFAKPTSLKAPPAESPREVARRLAEIRDWQGRVERMLLVSERRIRRLNRQLYITRLMLDVFLVALLAAVLAWWFIGRS
jgi:hypothetical protein